MTLHQLKIFQVVSQHRNITKASKELRISQPSVFQQVKSLEDSYKTKLYRKIGRGIELTEEGQLFQREVEEILRRVDSLEKKFRLQPTPPAGRLMIGASHGPSASLIPSASGDVSKGLILSFRLRSEPKTVSASSDFLPSLTASSLLSSPIFLEWLQTLPGFTSSLVALRSNLLFFVSTKHAFAGETRMTFGRTRRNCLYREANEVNPKPRSFSSRSSSKVLSSTFLWNVSPPRP